MRFHDIEMLGRLRVSILIPIEDSKSEETRLWMS